MARFYTEHLYLTNCIQFWSVLLLILQITVRHKIVKPQVEQQVLQVHCSFEHFMASSVVSKSKDNSKPYVFFFTNLNRQTSERMSELAFVLRDRSQLCVSVLVMIMARSQSEMRTGFFMSKSFLHQALFNYCSISPQSIDINYVNCSSNVAVL